MCEVQNFSRGTDLTIDNWILQLKTHFMADKIAPETMVGKLIRKILPKLFDEIRRFIGLSYYLFGKSCLKCSSRQTSRTPGCRN